MSFCLLRECLIRCMKNFQLGKDVPFNSKSFRLDTYLIHCSLLISFFCLQDFIFESFSFRLDRPLRRDVWQEFVIFSCFSFLAYCETLIRYIIHRPLSILLSRCLLSGFLCNWSQFYRNSLLTFKGSSFLRMDFIHSH